MKATARDHRADRIVHVMHLVGCFGPAGTELGIARLANLSDRARLRTSICSTASPPRRHPALAEDVALHSLDKRPGTDVTLVPRLVRLLRRERPDVVHTHGWGTLIEGLIATRLARVPAIVHGEHGTLDLRPRNVRVQRWAWRRVTQLLSVSSRLADRMAEQVGVERSAIAVIRNGVDSDRFRAIERAEARARLGLADDVPVIGTAGRLHPVKDQASLVRASRRLADAGRDHTILIAGRGTLTDELERLIRELDVADHVRLLGHRPDIEWVLKALDVFSLPSRSEGLSNAILDAMAAGLPVVATAVGGNDELVEDGTSGVLVPPEQPDALAAALATLIDHPERREQMGRRGEARARGEFSLPRMLGGYESVYRTLLGLVPGNANAG